MEAELQEQLEALRNLKGSELSRWVRECEVLHPEVQVLIAQREDVSTLVELARREDLDKVAAAELIKRDLTLVDESLVANPEAEESQILEVLERGEESVLLSLTWRERTTKAVREKALSLLGGAARKQVIARFLGGEGLEEDEFEAYVRELAGIPFLETKIRCSGSLPKTRRVAMLRQALEEDDLVEVATIVRSVRHLDQDEIRELLDSGIETVVKELVGRKGMPQWMYREIFERAEQEDWTHFAFRVHFELECSLEEKRKIIKWCVDSVRANPQKVHELTQLVLNPSYRELTRRQVEDMVAGEYGAAGLVGSAYRSDLTWAQFQRLVDLDDKKVWQALARNPGLPAEMQKEIAWSSEEIWFDLSINDALAFSPDLPAGLVLRAAKAKTLKKRGIEVATHPSFKEQLDFWLGSEKTETFSALAKGWVGSFEDLTQAVDQLS